MELHAEELKRTQTELKRRVELWTRTRPRSENPVPGLSLHREESRGQPHSYVREPAVCLILQGAKRVVLGSEVHVYDANHFLLASIDVPVVADILEASPGQPYLSLVFRLDHRMMSELIVGGDLPPLKQPQTAKSLMVSRHTLPLLQAVLRLVSLLDEPESIPILAPLAQKEILYRLLVGELGAHLRQTASTGTPSAQIGRAVQWLRSNFTRPIRVDDLAAYSQMSTTAFHHHFRQLTAMSPLQYQKWLRLQEARRLMLADHFDAARAAYEVGYESASQFSREYRRLFDAPPSQDIKTLRQFPLSNPA